MVVCVSVTEALRPSLCLISSPWILRCGAPRLPLPSRVSSPWFLPSGDSAQRLERILVASPAGFPGCQSFPTDGYSLS